LLYEDRELTRTAVKQLRIRPGTNAHASLRLSGAGLALAPPLLPLAKDPAVVAQLVNVTTNACWESTFSTSIVNDVKRFKAVSD
jgi:hypothetical protein